MKTVEITEASLAEYGRKTAKETWVLTRRGKPVAAVVPIRRGLAFETFSLSHSPDFIDLINRLSRVALPLLKVCPGILQRLSGIPRTTKRPCPDFHGPSGGRGGTSRLRRPNI
jgi:hypothetical protein